MAVIIVGELGDMSEGILLRQDIPYSSYVKLVVLPMRISGRELITVFIVGEGAGVAQRVVSVSTFPSSSYVEAVV
jgi:hypothetical protein